LRVAEQAASVCSTVSLVGDPLIYDALGLPVIPDHFPGNGPLAGIEAALAATVCETNLILACDMPAVEESLIRELLRAATDDSARPDCVVPMHADGRVEPLCAVYRKRCHPIIRAALDAGIRKVTDGLRGLAIRYVRVPDPAVFANLNTPEEWRRFHHG
jgi:molybdopterin-guanine dinucleotide biosynthesis protein A